MLPNCWARCSPALWLLPWLLFSAAVVPAADDADTLRVETEVLALRESRSRKNNGIVVFEHRAYNQHDMLVGTCKRTALMLRRTSS